MWYRYNIFERKRKATGVMSRYQFCSSLVKKVVFVSLTDHIMVWLLWYNRIAWTGHYSSQLDTIFMIYGFWSNELSVMRWMSENHRLQLETKSNFVILRRDFDFIKWIRYRVSTSLNKCIKRYLKKILMKKKTKL